MAGIGTSHLRSDEDLILRVEHLAVEYPIGRGTTVQAVSDVSFDVKRGETLGLVGESGCGKSTVARAVMRLDPAQGTVQFNGTSLDRLKGRDMRIARKKMKMIFQDPLSSINPRRRIKDVLSEPFAIWGQPDDPEERRRSALEAVGLELEAIGDRRAHEFSGGQCQRICIARALVNDPELIICDEVVSALDVSVQAQIVNLLEDLKKEYELTLIFISHNLAVVRNISDRLAVMYLGRLCEVAPAKELFAAPRHPYTNALVEASISNAAESGEGLDQSRVSQWSTSDEIPSPTSPPSGCRYRTRCPRAEAICAEATPEMKPIASGHYVACHFPVEVQIRSGIEKAI